MLVNAMKRGRFKRIKSPAIGATIAGLRYEGDTGFIVIELADCRELWVQADWEGYHMLCEHPDTAET